VAMAMAMAMAMKYYDKNSLYYFVVLNVAAAFFLSPGLLHCTAAAVLVP
jgi:hypothetical protein